MTNVKDRLLFPLTRVDSSFRWNDAGVLFCFVAILTHYANKGRKISLKIAVLHPYPPPSFQRKLESSGLCNTFPRKRE